MYNSSCCFHAEAVASSAYSVNEEKINCILMLFQGKHSSKEIICLAYIFSPFFFSDNDSLWVMVMVCVCVYVTVCVYVLLLFFSLHWK